MVKPVMKNYTPGCTLVKLFTDICVKHAKFFMGKTPCQVEKGEELGHIRGLFLKITRKKLRQHANLKPHKDAIESLTHLPIADTLSCSEDSCQKKESVNKLYVTKLIRIVHFLARHNLVIKELYKPLMNFISFKLEEPVTKQYIENSATNTIYDSHET